MNTVVNAIRSRLVTIAVWTVIILVVAGLVSANRATQARQKAALSSTDQVTRDAMVLSLVQSGHLIDALTNTQDPNTDAQSPQNLLSVTIRKNAADSVNRLAAAGKITDEQAMNTMLLLCKDGNADVKTTAKAGLQKVGEKNDHNLQAIVDRLKDGDPDIRGAAVDVLGAIGNDLGFGDKTARRVNAVILDPASQDSAETAMQKIGGPSEPYLAAHLDDANATIEFRQKIVDLLGQVGTASTLAPLTRMSHAPEPAVRREAVVSLANIILSSYTALQKATVAAQKASSDPKAKPDDVKKAQTTLATAADTFAQARRSEPILIAAIQSPDADSETRSQASLALGRTASAAAIKVLVAALGDYDSRVQQAALQGAQWAGPPAVGPLTATLARGDEQARAAAAEALGGIGNAPALVALDQAFNDPATPESVLRGAAIGLGRSGSPAVIPTLVHALGNKDGNVEAAASAALLSPKLSAASVAPLITTFTQPTPVPFNASQTLAHMGNQAVPELAKAAQSSDPQAQMWAAVTLGQTDSKDPQIVTVLTPLTSSGNAQVKFAAQQAINHLSS